MILVSQPYLLPSVINHIGRSTNSYVDKDLCYSLVTAQRSDHCPFLTSIYLLLTARYLLLAYLPTARRLNPQPQHQTTNHKKVINHDHNSRLILQALLRRPPPVSNQTSLAAVDQGSDTAIRLPIATAAAAEAIQYISQAPGR